MFIECPRCHARAQLPDSKEGAKVRCSECSSVYEAIREGAVGRRKNDSDSQRMLIIGGSAIAGVLILLLIVNGGSSNANNVPPPPAPEDVPTGPVVDEYGWGSAVVQGTKSLHDAASEGNTNLIQGRIEPQAAYLFTEARRMTLEGEGATASTLWGNLSQAQQTLVPRELAECMVSGTDKELVADWLPYHGYAEQDPMGERNVRIVTLETSHRDVTANHTDQQIRWRMKEVSGRWKAMSWERYYPDGKPRSSAGTGKVTFKTLSDGTRVKEGVMRVIPYDDGVPQELRSHIDGLIPKVLDLNLTRTRLPFEDELIAIGKPAIAPLLTKLTEIPFVPGEPNQRLEIIHRVLTKITGYENITFRAAESLGGTTERSQSGVLQWFGWYDRRYRNFKGNPNTVKTVEDDPFFGMGEEAWNALPDSEKTAILKAAKENEDQARIDKARREREDG
jgi:predicted Zn finger-like uncharacterized protein